jgi:excisionase family DNA binding protein
VSLVETSWEVLMVQRRSDAVLLAGREDEVRSEASSDAAKHGDLRTSAIPKARHLRTADERTPNVSVAANASARSGTAPEAPLDPPACDGDLRLISLSEAARFLCVSRGTLYDLLRTGQLVSVHIGRLRRIPFGELRRFVATRLESARRGSTPV